MYKHRHARTTNNTHVHATAHKRSMPIRNYHFLSHGIQLFFNVGVQVVVLTVAVIVVLTAVSRVATVISRVAAVVSRVVSRVAAVLCVKRGLPTGPGCQLLVAPARDRAQLLRRRAFARQADQKKGARAASGASA